MDKISGVVCTFNEAENIPRLMESLKDCDEILIFDDSSTDKTQELAKSLGAKVFTRNDKAFFPEEKDIADFKKRFGWLPRFTTKTRITDGNVTLNEAVSHAKNDWVFHPDADEFVTWDFPEIQKMLPLCDQIECMLVQSRNPDGTPLAHNNIIKLFRKSKSRWKGLTHTVVTGNNVKRIYTDKMKIDHHQKPKNRSNTLPFLEYSTLKFNDPRSLFYLAREYFNYGEFKKAIKLYKQYLKVGWWEPEIVDAHIKLSKCYWKTMQGDKSRKHCLEAIRNNPQCKEALSLMSVYYNEPWASKWKELSEHCTNQDVLFK